MEKIEVSWLDVNDSILGFYVRKIWYGTSYMANGEVRTTPDRDELISTIHRNSDGSIIANGTAYGQKITSRSNPSDPLTDIYSFTYLEPSSAYFSYAVIPFNSNGQATQQNASNFISANTPQNVPVPLGGTTTPAPPTTIVPTTILPTTTIFGQTTTTGEPTTSTTSTTTTSTTQRPTTTPTFTTGEPWTTTSTTSLPAHLYIAWSAYSETGSLIRRYPSYEATGQTYMSKADFGVPIGRTILSSILEHSDRRGFRLNGNSTYDPKFERYFWHFATNDNHPDQWEVKWKPHHEVGGGMWAGNAGQWVIGEKGANDAFTSLYYSSYIYPQEWEGGNHGATTSYFTGDDWFYINQPWHFQIINGGGQFFAGEEDITFGFSQIGVDLATSFSL